MRRTRTAWSSSGPPSLQWPQPLVFYSFQPLAGTRTRRTSSCASQPDGRGRDLPICAAEEDDWWLRLPAKGSFIRVQQQSRTSPPKRSIIKAILVVMSTHVDQRAWVEAGHDALTVRHCCYWSSLEGASVPAGVQSPSTTISTDNIFDAVALTAIMDKLSVGRTDDTSPWPDLGSRTPEVLARALVDAGWERVGGRRGSYERFELTGLSGRGRSLIVPLDRAAPEYELMLTEAWQEAIVPAAGPPNRPHTTSLGRCRS